MARATGIEIRGRMVTAALLEGGRSGARLLGFRSAALPADESERLYALVNFLSDIADDREWRSATTAVGLPAHEAMFRTVRLPFSGDEEVARTLEFEAEEHLPVSAEEAIMDYTIVARGEESTAALVAAVRTKTIGERLETFAAANIDPLSVGIGSVHTLEALVAAGQISGPTVVIDIGIDDATLSFTQDGGLTYIRAVTLPEDTAAEPPAETPLEPGEMGIALPSVRPAGLIAGTLAQDVERSLLAGGIEEIAQVILIGHGVSDELAYRLGERLDTEVIILRASDLIETPEDPNIAAELAAAGAIGAGLVALGGRSTMEFRRREHRYRRNFERMTGRLAAGLLLAALCALAGNLRLMGTISQANEERDDAVTRQLAAYERVFGRKRKPARPSTAQPEIEGQLNMLRARYGKGKDIPVRISALEVLRETSAALKQARASFTTSEISINQDRLTFRGTAGDAPAISRIRAAIDGCECTQPSDQIEMKPLDDGGFSFTIQRTLRLPEPETPAEEGPP